MLGLAFFIPLLGIAIVDMLKQCYDSANKYGNITQEMCPGNLAVDIFCSIESFLHWYWVH